MGLSKEDALKLQEEKDELKDLNALEGLKKSQAEFYENSSPELRKTIKNEKKDIIDTEIENKKKELELKKAHKEQIKEEEKEVKENIREIVHRGDANDPHEKLDLEKKRKRETELELNESFEDEDIQELNTELQEEEEIRKNELNLDPDDTVLSSIKKEKRE